MHRAILVLTIACCSCNSVKHECNPLPPAPHSVAVLGDSRIFDPTPKNFAGFANYLNQDATFKYFKNTTFTSEDSDPRTSTRTPGSDIYSSVGNTTAYALHNLPRVLAGPHDAMLIHLGVNSTGDPIGASRDLAAIAESARAKSWQVYIVTVGPWRGYPTWTQLYQDGTDGINRWIRDQGVRYSVIDVQPVVEDREHVQYLRADYTWDKLHYTSIAHSAIAADWISHIKTKGCGWDL